jgi:hypothetical protein
MDKFKHPQYLTPNGFVRSVKKPKLNSLLNASRTRRSTEVSGKEASATKIDSMKSGLATKSGALSAKSALAVKTTVLNSVGAPTRLRLLAEKRILAKQAQQRRSRGISDEAAKAIAEALTAMLHSK